MWMSIFLSLEAHAVLAHEAGEDLDQLTLRHLKDHCVKYERQLNQLNFNVQKTTTSLHIAQFYEDSTIRLKLVLTIDSSLVPSITVHGKPVQSTHEVFHDFSHIHDFSDLLRLLKGINTLFICAGNPDKHFVDHFGSKGNAYLEQYPGTGYTTIRAGSCQMLTVGARCSACSGCRSVLRSKEKRLREQKSVDKENILSSTRPNCSMSNEDIQAKQKLLKAKSRNLEIQNKRLRERICIELEKSAKLSETETGDVDALVKECTPQIAKQFPNSSAFQRIFWEEQCKYNELKSKSSMRWHPLIIKWALLIKSKSAKAYQTLKDSGFIGLPSERTLYNYGHCTPSKLGFVPEVVDMLVKECQQRGLYDAPWKKYVGILQDEMKVKSDLVYCPTTGQLIGFVNLDETSNQIAALEQGLHVDNTEPELATSALVLMVRSATSGFKFSLATFATNKLDALQLHTIIWRAIEILEVAAGLKVLYISCDGAGQNRKFFEMHRQPESDPKEPTNSCANPYADDDRRIYFISDVPHLVKTTRNCFANSKSHKMSRHLWNNGQDMSWTQIIRLYEEHIENDLFTKSFLNRAHIDLTSFSQMKVNLAAQVLSDRVAAHLEDAYGDSVSRTVEFIRHMNKFFDCLNTRHLYEGRDKRNPNLDVYTDADDPRLSYLSDAFLLYFDEWERSVDERPGNFTSQDRVKMQLSHQTLDGLKISVRSIVACVKFLLAEGAPFVMTVVFNQDDLEQHFGHYRHKGGACDNPTIDAVRHIGNSLRVIGSAALAPLRGNTKRRRPDDVDLETLCQPLARKKSRPLF